MLTFGEKHLRSKFFLTEKNFYAITGQQAKEICNDLQPEEGGVLIKNHKERLDQYVKKLEK